MQKRTAGLVRNLLITLTVLSLANAPITAAADTAVALPAPLRAADTRVEIVPAPDGADLITFFRNGVPQLTILRDTLGDPATGAHRFRQVWTYSYPRPGALQRIAAAIPFFYHRASWDKANPASAKPPKPLFDLSAPAKGTPARVAEQLAQMDVFDTYGILVRAPTRAYRGNTGDYRDMNLARSLEIVDSGAKPDVLPAELRDENWDEVRGRLWLSERLLGGYVGDERAEQVAVAEETGSAETRGSNWDFLRQCAEENGLYIEPLIEEPGAPREAVVWFADTPKTVAPRTFDARYLGISNPFGDPQMAHWDGYTAQWFLDPNGVRVDAGAPGAQPVRMIPLALYALDYPRVPLLLMDFHSDRARRREVVRRAADQITTGIFGITPYSSLSWFTARNTYMFVRDRQGAALNRVERMNAYARLRQILIETGTNIDPKFRRMLEAKLDGVALNPFEQDAGGEAALAGAQYSALLKWVQSPDGLSKMLDHERAAEYFDETHTPGRRAWIKTLEIGSLGLYRPVRAATPDTLQALDRYRTSHSPDRSSPTLPVAAGQTIASVGQ
jgi:hypothetical protein